MPHSTSMQRLAALGLLTAQKPGIVAATQALGAMQAQDYAMSLWAVGIRSAATRQEVAEALDDGRLIRTHLLRPTWHIVAAADLRWLLRLSGPRVLQMLQPTGRQFGLEPAQVRKALRIFEKALADGEKTREELRPLLTADRISTDEHRMAFLLMSAELEGIICSGPRRGKQHSYALLDNRIPDSRIPFEGDEALAELARRYFRSRGPATLADFTWWSGLPRTRTAPALQSIRHELESCGPDLHRISTGTPPGPATPLLLPAFDEFLISYRDRTAQLSEAHRAQVLTRNGLFRPTLIHDGRVCATWRLETNLAEARVVIEPLPGARQPAPGKLAGALRNLGAFLQVPVLATGA